MSTLKQRIQALETKGSDGLVLLLISWLPRGGRETATYEGVTYTQAQDESPEQFRERLAEALKSGKTRFVWVSEMDAAL